MKRAIELIWAPLLVAVLLQLVMWVAAIYLDPAREKTASIKWFYLTWFSLPETYSFSGDDGCAGCNKSTGFQQVIYIENSGETKSGKVSIFVRSPFVDVKIIGPRASQVTREIAADGEYFSIPTVGGGEKLTAIIYGSPNAPYVLHEDQFVNQSDGYYISLSNKLGSISGWRAAANAFQWLSAILTSIMSTGVFVFLISLSVRKYLREGILEPKTHSPPKTDNKGAQDQI